MATTSFTIDELQNFFSGKYFHAAYDETVKMADEIKVHADGIYPIDLIEERRPSESLAVKEYREKIWEPITEPTFSKILTSLNKIRRSSDWSIKFGVDEFGSIPEGERLNDYCETNFPFFSSLTNWAFGVLLKEYAVDSNALICTFPIEAELVENEFIKPFPYSFYSDQVIDYVQDDYAVLKSANQILYTEKNIQKWGDCYYIITTERVEKWEQVNSKRDFNLKWEYVHELGYLPVVKTKGIFKKSLDGNFIFKSRLNANIPRLNEAVREYSDLQAEVVQHIFSEKWEYVSDDCPTCKGKGILKSAGFNGGDYKCTECDGSGNRPRGPYTTLQLKSGMAGENNNIPTPPIGYVQKDTAIVKIQDERIDKHIFQALASINMEFLATTPLTQSGIAKEVDRDDLNTFVHSIAEDIVAVLDSVAYFINDYRYKVIIPDDQRRASMLPTISVPEKFDILSTNYLEEELKNAKTNKSTPAIVNAMEVEYANKRFNNDPSVREKVSLMLSLDPLAGISEDDRMLRLSNSGITKETYIIACNVQEFIDRAIEDKGDAFYNMSLKDKKELMKTYAKEQIDGSSTTATILGPSE